MKNFINYYYNFYISDIHLIDGKYFFSYDGNSYMFKNCSDIVSIIDSIYELSQQLSYHNSYYHQLIYNKDKSLITFFEGKPFVMLKLSSVSNMPISIFDIKGLDIVNVDRKIEKIIRFNWTILWEEKIDYFEQQIFSKKDEYGSLLDSFNYYVGMAENAILYVREALKNQDEYPNQLVASHRRFYNNMSLIDFYDPTNLIVDHRSRDVAEFLKFLFISNDYDFSVINDFLNKYRLSKLDAHLLFGRLLFPGFYFDYLEKSLFNQIDDSIFWLEDRTEEYNQYIMEIYLILNKQFEMQEIQWLKK